MKKNLSLASVKTIFIPCVDTEYNADLLKGKDLLPLGQYLPTGGCDPPG